MRILGIEPVMNDFGTTAEPNARARQDALKKVTPVIVMAGAIGTAGFLLRQALILLMQIAPRLAPLLADSEPTEDPGNDPDDTLGLRREISRTGVIEVRIPGQGIVHYRFLNPEEVEITLRPAKNLS